MRLIRLSCPSGSGEGGRLSVFIPSLLISRNSRGTSDAAAVVKRSVCVRVCVCQGSGLPLSSGNRGKKRERTLTLHYLYLVVLAEAAAASHCVFIMRSRTEQEGGREGETSLRGEEGRRRGGWSVCLSRY